MVGKINNFSVDRCGSKHFAIVTVLQCFVFGLAVFIKSAINVNSPLKLMASAPGCGFKLGLLCKMKIIRISGLIYRAELIFFSDINSDFAALSITTNLTTLSFGLSS